MKIFKIGILLLIALTLVGCDQNRFTYEIDIKPKLTKVGNKVAVQFELGDLLILDEWEELNTGQLLYIMDESTEKIIHLRIEFGDFSTSTDGFYYMIGANEVFTQPVDWKIISRHVVNWPNVVWSMKDGKTISSEEQEMVKDDGLKDLTGDGTNTDL